MSLGRKKWANIVPSLYDDANVQGYVNLLDQASAAGYNGCCMLLSTGQQFATETLWKQPNFIANVGKIKAKCKEKGMPFVLGFLNAICPEKDPKYFEGVPVKDQRFVVNNGYLVPDNTENRLNLPDISFTDTGSGRWWGNWNLGTCYSRPYTSLNFKPIFTEKDFVEKKEGDFSLRFSIPTLSWSAGTSYPQGTVIVKNNRVFFANVGGVSGSVEPNWSNSSLVVNNTTLDKEKGDVLIDNEVHWVYQGSAQLGMLMGYYYGAVKFSYVDISFNLKFKNYAGTSFTVYIASVINNQSGSFYSYLQTVDLTKLPRKANADGTYDMDWTKIHIPINTTDTDKLSVQIIFNKPTLGCTLWVDNMGAPSAGITNILRREGTPINVRTLDGTSCAEGIDFCCAADPKVGLAEVWHWDTGMPTMTIPAASRLKEGDVVLMDYYHTGFINLYNYNDVKPCLSEPALFEYYKTYLPKALALFNPDGWLVQTSEVRVLGWDKSCTNIGTAGQVLAAYIKKVRSLIRAISTKTIYVWNDMFDPYHNGTDGRKYMITSAYNSWLGLTKDVVVLNWNVNVDSSTDFFAGRGQPQIMAGYYDDSTLAGQDAWIAHAASKLAKGGMYTTWGRGIPGFADMGKFIDILKKYD